MNPSPEEIKQARLDAGLTQRAAADLLYLDTNTWKSWEYGINPMPQDRWEHFLTKTCD